MASNSDPLSATLEFRRLTGRWRALLPPYSPDDGSPQFLSRDLVLISRGSEVALASTKGDFLMEDYLDAGRERADPPVVSADGNGFAVPLLRQKGIAAFDMASVVADEVSVYDVPSRRWVYLLDARKEHIKWIAGNQTRDAAHTYQYDAEGRLISVDNGSTATYVYNGPGERVGKDVAGTYTEYMFDRDGNPIGKNNRSAWTDTWVIFNRQHMAHYENGETYFVHANNVGTTAFVTDYTGAVIQDETHYPWGQEWATKGTMEEERFASLRHRDSETTLDPTLHRMYASGQGRWFTPNPVRSCPFHPENFDAITG